MQGTMGKGALEIAGFASIYSQEKWIKKQQEELLLINNNFFVEPTSVLLHMRRSQSPPTSASTLSSSFNGGGGGGGGGGNNSTDNTTTATATIATEPTTTTTTTIHHHLPHLVNESRKEDWSTELQPIPSGLEIVSTTTGGGERCGLGGLEDWESMLSESAASPSQEQSFLRWIAGDVDDTSFGLKQLLQSGNSSLDFDGNAAGLGIVDQGGPGFEPISGSGSGITGAGNLIAAPNLVGFHGSGFVTNNNGNGKIGSIGTITPSSSSGLVNYKVGLNSINNNNTNCNIQNPMFTSPPNNLPLPVSLPMIYHHQQQQSHQFVETPEEKPHIIMNPQQQQQQQQQQQSQHHPQNPNFFLPLPFAQQEQQHQLLQHQLKRHNSGTLDPTTQIPKLPFSDPSHEFLLRKQMGFPQGVQFLHQQKPMMIPKQEMAAAQQQQQQQQQHTLLDQLYKAAELIGTGNFSHAQAILARLNHQLSPVGKPLIRAAFYFKEALQLLLLMNNPVTSPPPRSPTPFDVFFKMGAYKVFSEVSPLIQFVNFTCNQALLEALDDADRIHIVDFDIGFGAQWASFMQELPMRSRGAPSLRITAFASPSTHHPVELGLMRENLTQFANEIGVTFELDVVNFDSLDQTNYSLPLFRSNENEAVAVNFPIWSSSSQPYALPSLLRFVKQLSPKIVVSLDRGCDRSDLPFPQHIVHALQSYINLLESLDAVNVTSDAVNKIERFLLQPRIESTVLGRLRAPDKMPLWKTLFASSGFSPVMFSNFTEAQAECVVKRTPVRGFHVEKRQASLVLCWQRRELISALAWRC